MRIYGAVLAEMGALWAFIIMLSVNVARIQALNHYDDSALAGEVRPGDLEQAMGQE